jgi:alkyldihydroxyacetonephosphate synthase
LLDATEAMVTGTDDGSAHLLLIGFESADHPLDPWIGRAAELARDHGGDVPDDALRTRTDEATREGSSGAWRNAFLRAPYTRDALVAMGMVNETFETATTWDRFDALYGDVMDSARSPRSARPTAW